MKKIIYISLIIVVLIPIGWIVYNKLPVDITRKSDIRFGNELIHKIEDYKSEHSQLPLSDDWELLKRLGFRVEQERPPFYQKISDDEYELVYLEGFDGPYLLYNSKEKKWKVDFPKATGKNIESNSGLYDSRCLK